MSKPLTDIFLERQNLLERFLVVTALDSKEKSLAILSSYMSLNVFKATVEFLETRLSDDEIEAMLENLKSSSRGRSRVQK